MAFPSFIYITNLKKPINFGPVKYGGCARS